MKNSIWLDNYVKDVQGKRNKSGQNKKVILIIIPVMMVLFMVAAMAGSGEMDPQVMSGMLTMLGVFAFVMLFAIIMIGKGKKIDAAKGTRENVLALLKTDEDVDYFDQQMNSAPIREVKIGTAAKMFLTMDYVGVSFLYLGDLQYRFARRTDIATIEYSRTSSTGANPMKASYIFDVKDQRNERVLREVAETGTQLEQVIELLKEVQPNLVVIKK